jgi:hypothetical protein
MFRSAEEVDDHYRFNVPVIISVVEREKIEIVKQLEDSAGFRSPVREYLRGFDEARQAAVTPAVLNTSATIEYLAHLGLGHYIEQDWNGFRCKQVTDMNPYPDPVAHWIQKKDFIREPIWRAPHPVRVDVGLPKLTLAQILPIWQIERTKRGSAATIKHEYGKLRAGEVVRYLAMTGLQNVYLHDTSVRSAAFTNLSYEKRNLLEQKPVISSHPRLLNESTIKAQRRLNGPRLTVVKNQ